MKPMTKERLEELRLKIERELSRFKGMNFFESEWASEMNECLSEIQRLRGALTRIQGVEDLPWGAYNIAKQALSPSDETEVTK